MFCEKKLRFTRRVAPITRSLDKLVVLALNRVGRSKNECCSHCTVLFERNASSVSRPADGKKLERANSLLIPGFHFPERHVSAVERDFFSQRICQSGLTLHGGYCDCLLCGGDCFRESAALRVRSCKCPDEVWISATRKLHCFLRELDCFNAVTDRAIRGCREHPRNVVARMRVSGC